MTEEEKQEALLKAYGELFAQLLESERFNALFQTYFTLQKIVDEETKTVNFIAIENPPEIIAQKMRDQAQEAGSKIEVVSKSAAKRIVAQAGKKLKRKK